MIVCYSGSQMLVGSLLGSTTLGLYTLAFTFAGLPVQFVSHAISRVAFPAYAQRQQEPAVVARLYALVTSLLGWILCPLSTVAALTHLKSSRAC